MTAEQQNKVITLRDRFAKRRAQAMANWEFASDRLNITRDEYQLRSDEWHALDVLVSAPDATLLAIAEAIR